MGGKKKGKNKSATSQWGGKREGAGRKTREAETLFDVDVALEKMKAWAEKEDKTLDDILLLIAYGKSSQVTIRDRLAAIKIFKEFTKKKPGEGDTVSRGPLILHKELMERLHLFPEELLRGRTIILPELKEDPSKVIPIDRGKTKGDNGQN